MFLNTEDDFIMDDLKKVVANNLIHLRQKSGMTQAELGEKLNYSDKTVSKWERAESLPDAYVLKQLSEIFDVSVDLLLSPHEEHEKEPKKTEHSYSSNMIMLVTFFGIWTAALFVFIIFWICGDLRPGIFIAAVPVSLVALLIMRTIWKQGRHNYWIVSAIVLSLFFLAYACFWRYHPWQILLLILPAELLVYFSFRIKRR